MKITAQGLWSDAKISGVPIKLGTHNYNLDSKDPLTAKQLVVYRNLGLITFDEIIHDEFIAEVDEALNAGTLEVDVKKTFPKSGPRRNIPESIEYKGSTIPKKVKKDVRKPSKSTKKAGRNND